MRANLSLVLDKEGYVRIDLKKDIEISEIDKYTTSCASSKEVREDYKEQIESFLEEQRAFIRTFKRDQDKKGRVVITYLDEKNKLHRLRVLYKDNAKKLNTSSMIKNIRKTLEEESTFNKTLEVINHFSGFIFGSEFDRKEIRRLKKRFDLGVSEKLCNKNLVKSIIYNHLELTLSRNPEKAYFHVRLIDSYIEKNGMFTTKDKKTSKVKNLKVGDVPANARINRNISRLKDGEYFMESDGQYNLFGDNDSIPKPVVMSYEDYLEKEEERRLGK